MMAIEVTEAIISSEAQGGAGNQDEPDGDRAQAADRRSHRITVGSPKRPSTTPRVRRDHISVGAESPNRKKPERVARQ